MKLQLARSLAVVVVVSLVSGCQADRREEPGLGTESTSETVEGAIDVWLDVDPAIGLPQAEVDDGVMMIQAFHSPELVIHGVSVVFGNTALENGVPIANDLVQRFGPEGLHVAAGAAAADQLGEATAATDALAEALRQRPMHLLAVGPVTNVGSLLLLHPELSSRIESVVMVAARRVGQSFRATPGQTAPPFRDFNFELDPAAMQVILDSEVPIVFAPWEVSSHVWITDEDLATLGSASPTGKFLQESTASWIERWKTNLGTLGFNPFDTLAVAWLTHPELIASMEVGVWIEEAQSDIDPAETKPYLFVSQDAAADRRRAIYTYEPAAEFKDMLMRRLAGSETSP